MGTESGQEAAGSECSRGASVCRLGAAAADISFQTGRSSWLIAGAGPSLTIVELACVEDLALSVPNADRPFEYDVFDSEKTRHSRSCRVAAS